MASRVSIPSEHHSIIDACLKALKGNLRNLSALEDTFAEESQVLERIYYKSKNQHRSALFWRKAVEVRRIGSRVKSTGISKTLGSVRDGFYDASLGESSKSQKKQAWSKVPPSKLVLSAVHQMYDATRLFSKAEQVFKSGYEAFELLMQSNTFLPLALTLVAISSRMGALGVELQLCLDALIPTIRDIARVIGCDKSLPKSLHTTDALNPKPAISQRREQAPTGHTVVEDSQSGMDLDDDIGQTVARETLTPLAMIPPEAPIPSSNSQKYSKYASEAPKSNPDTRNMVARPQQSNSTEPDQPPFSTRSPHSSPAAGKAFDNVLESSRSAAIASVGSKRKGHLTSFQAGTSASQGEIEVAHPTPARSKKTSSSTLKPKMRKKKGDEIDDIFGGM